MHELIQECLPDIKAAVNRVIDSGVYVLGPEGERLEEEIADLIGVNHAVGVGSGTAALELSLKALGIGPGDEVIVPALTFAATAEAVVNVGATPVFADVNHLTWNLDVETVAPWLSDKSAAIIAVHLFGNPAPIHELRAFDLPIIEDACQAIGAALGEDACGSMGDLGVFSFYPSKNLPGIGDGGMVVSNNFDLADEVRLLRSHGSRDNRRHQIVGTTSRLDEIQAAAIRTMLPLLPYEQARRNLIVGYLTEMEVPLQQTLPDAVHAWHQIVGVAADEQARHEVIKDIPGARNFYRVPLHMQEAFAPYFKSELPVSEIFGRINVAFPTDSNFWGIDD